MLCLVLYKKCQCIVLFHNDNQYNQGFGWRSVITVMRGWKGGGGWLGVWIVWATPSREVRALCQLLPLIAPRHFHSDKLVQASQSPPKCLLFYTFWKRSVTPPPLRFTQSCSSFAILSMSLWINKYKMHLQRYLMCKNYSEWIGGGWRT